MQLLKFIFCTLFFLGTVAPAQAIMVQYIDEYGKVHYVNTDYANVPQKYYYQVKDQIEKAAKKTDAEKAAANPSPVKTPEPEPTPAPPPIDPEAEEETKKEPKKVELFVGADCSQCYLLESVLRQRKIVYQKYDIGSDPGREKYHELGVRELPVTKVGSKVILGFDLNGIFTALKE